jgi:excisionase family DNA binding protein
MENVVFTNLSIPEIRQLFRQELETYFEANNKPEQPTEQPEQLLTIQEAAEFLSLTVPTMYSKVSKREIPCMKRSKRLYFSRTELLNYIKEGRKKSNAEIEQEAEAYFLNNKKGLNNGK